MGAGPFSLVAQLNHKAAGALGGPSLLVSRACQPWLHRGDSPKAVPAACMLLLRWDSKCVALAVSSSPFLSRLTTQKWMP